MRIGYPRLAQVEGCDPHGDTLTLLRWKTFLPLPTTPEQKQIAVLVVQKLDECDGGHREVIEKAVGYAS